MFPRHRFRASVGAFVWFALGLMTFSFSQQSEKPAARLTVEFGIDSFERRSYRPEFNFTWPFPPAGRGRLFFDLSYLQRINGRLRGPVDFWLRGGLERPLLGSLALEASLNHFCRHLTSMPYPAILNYNELVGKLWWRTSAFACAAGYGRYVGGSPGLDQLLVFNLNVPRLVFPELSFESEWKWVDFSNFYYEAGLAVDLSEGAALYVRTAKYYNLPGETSLGLRLSSEGSRAKILDQFHLVSGFYPYFNAHKLLVSGSYRLDFIRKSDRRFFFNVGFGTPILSGSGFFVEFWPDRMLYNLSAEYELRIGPLFAAWYTRYSVDMPTDTALPFESSLGTGILIRNQTDFDRLERRVRFEAGAGYNFRYAYDFSLKFGLNTLPRKGPFFGADVRWGTVSGQNAFELKLFAAFGRDVSIRPFAGLRNIRSLAGGPPISDSFKNRLTAGAGLFAWFD